MALESRSEGNLNRVNQRILASFNLPMAKPGR